MHLQNLNLIIEAMFINISVTAILNECWIELWINLFGIWNINLRVYYSTVKEREWNTMNKLFLIGALAGIGFGLYKFMKKGDKMQTRQEPQPEA